MNTYECPHCGETVDTDPDLGGGEYQDYIEDCAVCCRPNRIVAHLIPGEDNFEIRVSAEV